ncbi:hypothetical protein KIW84_056351 [Lathyrus oleraceus]|uniref:pyruvate decarboxylase n=1 Tax=Pisum sativum TaxID=3888 RepID=A0A9D5AL73_PEA|nr:hypothetical protein KIW84_056351 [Pisum sativum]
MQTNPWLQRNQQECSPCSLALQTSPLRYKSPAPTNSYASSIAGGGGGGFFGGKLLGFFRYSSRLAMEDLMRELCYYCRLCVLSAAAGIWPELGFPRRPEMPMVGPCSYRLCMVLYIALLHGTNPITTVEKGLGYEFQMQYGSIGWSVGATLGYAQAVPEKRVIAFFGDGSFQGGGHEY